MILVIGTSHDDILYFESKLRNKVYEKFMDSGVYFTGSIVGQSICVAYGLNTNYLSSVFTTFLLNKFNAPVVINVGMARAFTNDFKIGDVMVARDVCLGDVNLVNCTRVKLAQLPTMPQMLISDIYLVNLLNSIGGTLFINNVKSGTLISSSNYYTSIDELINLKITDGKEVLGKDRFIALDNEAGGIAVACYAFSVPFVSIKIIQYDIGKENYSKENFIKALKSYPDIGKLVTSLIAEISSNVTVTVRT